LIYCLLPADLAAELHEPLRRHFAMQPGVDVVVERRAAERRGPGDRRQAAERPHPDERRAVRNPAGRRVGERRVLSVGVSAPTLPRQARGEAARIVFVEIVEPLGLDAEDLDTRRVVTRIQAGDMAAFETLYRRYFDRVYAYLKVALRSGDEAEDMAQQVFLKVLEALPRYEYRPGTPFRAWLFVIVRRHAISRLREAGRLEIVDVGDAIDERTAAPERDPSALSWLSDREMLVFVNRLPLAQQQVLVLRFMLDLTSQEIAEVLDISADNVRVLQHRALGFLRQRLGAVGFEQSRAPRARSRSVIRKSPVLRTRRFALAFGDRSRARSL
jgi:RNA polymerase sigma-70 factor, ECF subfamily